MGLVQWASTVGDEHPHRVAWSKLFEAHPAQILARFVAPYDNQRLRHRVYLTFVQYKLDTEDDDSIKNQGMDCMFKFAKALVSGSHINFAAEFFSRHAAGVLSQKDGALNQDKLSCQLMFGASAFCSRNNVKIWKQGTHPDAGKSEQASLVKTALSDEAERPERSRLQARWHSTTGFLDVTYKKISTEHLCVLTDDLDIYVPVELEEKPLADGTWIHALVHYFSL